MAGRSYLKVVAALVAAALGIGLLLFQQKELSHRFRAIQRINATLDNLYAETIALQESVLAANYYLYYDYDPVYKTMKKVQEEIGTLLEDPHLQKNPRHAVSVTELKKLKRRFDNLSATVNRFLTLNSAIKNSAIYLPTLSLKAYENFDLNDPSERRAVMLLSRLNASLFLAKNALDESFLKSLRAGEKGLEEMARQIKVPSKRRILTTSVHHLDIFIRLFPRFHRALSEILDPVTKKEIIQIRRRFGRESSRELNEVNRWSQGLLVLYLLSLGVVLYFVYLAEREAAMLRRAQEELLTMYRTDPLTGLGNREAYRLAKRQMRHPVLLLINIDGFNHINEFYGTDVGDKLLVAIARRLQEAVPPKAGFRCFRMGGDEFGLLFEYESDSATREMAEAIIRAMERERFEIDGFKIDVAVSIGASSDAGRLFETADMALKAVKKAARLRYALFDPSFNISYKIAANLEALQQLKEAFARDAVVPFFQPIVNLATGEVYKYEALARLIREDGEVLTPYHFIEVAKQAKYSGVLTGRILQKTLEVAQKVDAQFSVNVSAEDIADESDRRMISEMLENNRAYADRIAFEILETEEVEDYESVAAFIREVRRYGCRISIDDFGSGYSNYEKLLQLEIDYLKIDGSLIRDVDHNAHARLVVRTLVTFAKEAGIATVAEFVHSEMVCRAVRSLGIDFAQGYWLGEPKPADFYFSGDRPGIVSVDCGLREVAGKG
ncbi:EAL domain-containing protein [Hydrogenimonas sp. SS33]|uniref:EAL domain-containing protein n=1 Tax=Hydrogenimonas leucolamina TaxID=2954236 RepID=UPI00336C1B81